MGAGGSAGLARGEDRGSVRKVRRFSVSAALPLQEAEHEAPTDHSRAHRPGRRISISVHRKNSIGEQVRLLFPNIRAEY